MLTQLMNSRVVIARHLVRQGQICRIEDARLAAEQLKQASGLFRRQSRKGPLAQRSIEERDARRWLLGAEAFRRPALHIRRI